MAHQLTEDEINTAAAQAAAPAVDESPTESVAPVPGSEKPILVYGASGPNVEMLIALLTVGGYTSVANQGKATIDAGVIGDIVNAQAHLQIDEPAGEIPIEGPYVGRGMWTALYELAASKLAS